MWIMTVSSEFLPHFFETVIFASLRRHPQNFSPGKAAPILFQIMSEWMFARNCVKMMFNLTSGWGFLKCLTISGMPLVETLSDESFDRMKPDLSWCVWMCVCVHRLSRKKKSDQPWSNSSSPLFCLWVAGAVQAQNKPLSHTTGVKREKNIYFLPSSIHSKVTFAARGQVGCLSAYSPWLNRLLQTARFPPT